MAPAVVIRDRHKTISTGTLPTETSAIFLLAASPDFGYRT